MVETSARPVGKERMFHELAKYYDLLASGKDYGAETRRLEELARAHGRSMGRDWLDVACGTGRHLEHLRRSREVVGLDLSPQMLAIARRRLPGVRLYRRDMRSFDLARKFDVVTCLYSAIGHVGSERELAAVYESLARHLKPGGVAIVEPWFTPGAFHDGSAHVVSTQTRELAIARVAYSRRSGSRSTVRYRYLVARSGRGFEQFEDTSPGLLVRTSRHLELMRRAGLSPRYLARGLSVGRGLLVGVRRPVGPVP